MWPFRRRADPAASPQPGDVIADKYRVERVLGVGGMGVVVAARHVKLDDVVALKLLRPHVVRSRDDIVRFLREGRAASKLKSEHVVRILDLGELPGEVPFLVMEHLDGRDFAAILREHASMGAEMAVGHVVESVLEACEAVAEAHALGIVHRDLKPANLFLARMPGGSSRVKVLDFGISKLTHEQGNEPDLSLTQTRTLMGSPIYMAPEVLRSARSADARSDVWALGCILYELLTGTTPFRGETLTELTAQILEQTPRAPSRFRADVAPELDGLVLRCLSQKPEARFADAGALARALASLAGARGAQMLDRLEKVVRSAELRARSTPLVETGESLRGSVKDAEGEATLRGWGTTRGAVASSRRRLAVISVAAAAVLGAAGLALHFGGTSKQATAASAPEPAFSVPIAPSSNPIAIASAPPTVASASSKPPPPKKKLVTKKSPSGPSTAFDDPN